MCIIVQKYMAWFPFQCIVTRPSPVYLDGGTGKWRWLLVSAFFLFAFAALPAIIAAEGNRFMPVRTTLLTLAALALFAAAYRFGSHGIKLKDNRCIGLACVALTLGALLLGCEFWMRRRQHK
jgi:hypothetical protein